MIPWLDNRSPFPDVSTALTEADGAPGLLAAGGDLSSARLLDAYRHGIFPWFSDGQPILWWSPDPRMVLYTDRFVVSHSLRKRLRQVERSMRAGGPWEVRFDTAFEQVMRNCAGQRRDGGGTWISEQMIRAYVLLHQSGAAHSAELWKDGELAAGAYGLCIGRIFYGESMFTKVSDGSKIALAYLVHFLKSQGVPMIDCQQETAHLASLGAVAIPRSEFVENLKELVSHDEIVNWHPMDLSGDYEF